MREAQLTCLCNEYYLSDLGIKLQKGEVIFLSEDQITKSEDLFHAGQIKAVAIKWVERYQVAKQNNNAPPFMRRDLKRKLPEPAPVIDHDALKKTVQEAAHKAVEGQMSVIAAHLSQMVEAMRKPSNTPVGSDVIQAAVEQAVKAALGQGISPMPVGIETPSTSIEGWDDADENPMFIPSNIVDVSAKANVSVQSGEVKGTDNLDETMAAMKALKSRKKKTLR